MLSFGATREHILLAACPLISLTDASSWTSGFWIEIALWPTARDYRTQAVRRKDSV
jgi:hypothetical protein